MKTPVIERSYSAIGIGMYDALAYIGSRGKKGVPSQRHFTKKGTKTVFPDIKDSAFTGAIQFYDARVDDARLVVDVVRTPAVMVPWLPHVPRWWVLIKTPLARW